MIKETSRYALYPPSATEAHDDGQHVALVGRLYGGSTANL